MNAIGTILRAWPDELGTDPMTAIKNDERRRGNREESRE